MVAGCDVCFEKVSTIVVQDFILCCNLEIYSTVVQFDKVFGGEIHSEKVLHKVLVVYP